MNTVLYFLDLPGHVGAALVFLSYLLNKCKCILVREMPPSWRKKKYLCISRKKEILNIEILYYLNTEDRKGKETGEKQVFYSVDLKENNKTAKGAENKRTSNRRFLSSDLREITDRHRIVKVERNLWRLSGPVPLLKMGPRAGWPGACPGCFGRRLHNFSGQSVPVLSKSGLPDV